MSRFLKKGQQLGFQRAGLALVPGGEGLPSFVESGCAQHLDRMLSYLPEADARAFAGLMGLFRWLPLWLIRALLVLSDRHALFPGPVGAALRQLRLGVFGAVYSLYYADDAVLNAIGWDAKVNGVEKRGEG